MKRLLNLALLTTLLASLFLLPTSVVQADTDVPPPTNCLYPSAADRFGITVYSSDEITRYNVTPLSAGRYLNWRADLTPARPNAIPYYFMVRVGENTFFPNVDTLKSVAFNNPGSTWIIGNEADVIWQDNTTPAAYARVYHTVYNAIKSIDPTAKFVISGVVQVSPLRLHWLDLVWDSYYSMYGTEIPVDIWNIHTYIANEMHQEWGFEIPPGIPNAVGYSNHPGTDWSEVAITGASGGTIHQSRIPGAKATFAFHGADVTLYLWTGPDAGIAEIYVDQVAAPVAEVDLYSQTPASIEYTLTGLVAPGGILTDRHNIRVQVTGRRNSAATDTWIKVDAVAAPSTASLPGGRFEDNSPLRARIITSIDAHDNLEVIAQQILDFRQWMLEHGQRNKPLINTEHGILMTEDLGFDYTRVRTFMLNSFNLFLNQLVDTNLGYPADDNRLLQEWFWFALAVDDFEGRTTATGLFSEATRTIKPLGTDFSNYVSALAQNYTDLEVYAGQATPYWPIFAGQSSLLHIEALLRNRGTIASGPFNVNFRAGNGTLLQALPNPGLPKRFDPGYIVPVSYDWVVPMTAGRGIKIIADEENVVPEPCNPNNEYYLSIPFQSGTDLALVNLRTNPAPLSPILPDTTTTIRLQVDLRNLGGVGTSASQVQVKFWHGNPDAGGQLIGTQTFTPANTTLPVTVTLDWPDRGVGQYEIYARVDTVAGDTNLQNNTQHLTVLQSATLFSFPITKYNFRESSANAGSYAENSLWAEPRAAFPLPQPEQ